MRLLVILSALFIVSTHTAPTFNSQSFGDLTNNPSDNQPLKINAAPFEGIGNVETQSTELAENNYDPVEGMGYQAPAAFECAASTDPDPKSQKYCGYHNRRFFVCQRASSRLCYLGDIPGSPNYQICADIPVDGRICINYVEPSPVQISTYDLNVWKHQNDQEQSHSLLDSITCHFSGSC